LNPRDKCSPLGKLYFLEERRSKLRVFFPIGANINPMCEFKKLAFGGKVFLYM
jgi:hypothetical protein